MAIGHRMFLCFYWTILTQYLQRTCQFKSNESLYHVFHGEKKGAFQKKIQLKNAIFLVRVTDTDYCYAVYWTGVKTWDFQTLWNFHLSGPSCNVL